MEKKKYIAPDLDVCNLTPENIMHWWTGVTNFGYDDESTTPGAKKRGWDTWENNGVNNVGTSAGTGNSPLELPSGGKLWGD